MDRADLGERLGDWWGTTKAMNDANAMTAGNTEMPSYGTLGAIASQAGAAYAGKGKGLKTTRGPQVTGLPGDTGYGWKNGTGGF
jgi:hypothetical protein